MEGWVILCGVIFAVGVVVLLMVICEHHSDKKKYNNGICTRCGHKLSLFDDEDSIRRGFRCDNCGRIIYVGIEFGKR